LNKIRDRKQEWRKQDKDMKFYYERVRKKEGGKEEVQSTLNK